MEILEIIILIIAYVIPLYLANATPIIIHGKKPLDFGKNWKGKRILGDGKSIVGSVAGVIVGFLAAIIFSFSYPPLLVTIPNYLFLAFLLAFGAILGDIVESFFKRRMGLKRGAQLILCDQLDFVIGGLILSLIIRIPELEVIVVLLIATIFIHIITNFIAFKLKLKKVPW